MSQAKLKVAILYDQWDDGEPVPVAAPPEPAPARKKRKVRKKHPKEDREEVFDALQKLGHEPFYQILDGRSQTMVALARTDADLVFNLTESYAGDDTMDMNIAAYLDLLGKRYTGSGPQALYLAQDKSIAKKIFGFHRIRTPFFATSYKGVLDHSQDISFPLIVKPTSEDGSIGIDSGSVVTSIKDLMERIHYLQEKFDCAALIEEYIEGREIYVSILGNDSPKGLPLIELDLSKLPKGTPRIAGMEVKWEKETEAYKVTKSAIAEDIDEEIAQKVTDTAIQAYRALKLRDYGRIDMRLTGKGEVYVIEANPNPWLSSAAEFALAARKSGRTYPQLIQEIVDLAMLRYEKS